MSSGQENWGASGLRKKNHQARASVEYAQFWSKRMSLEIICTACGVDSLVRKEPVYEGLKKTGDQVFCAACGHEYSSDQVPYKEKTKAPQVFDDDDKPTKLDIFAEEDRLQNCRHCEHYVANPFVQRCSLHDKEVDATDVCFDFNLKEEKADEDGDQSTVTRDEELQSGLDSLRE